MDSGKNYVLAIEKLSPFFIVKKNQVSNHSRIYFLVIFSFVSNSSFDKTTNFKSHWTSNNNVYTDITHIYLLVIYGYIKW